MKTKTTLLPVCLLMAQGNLLAQVNLLDDGSFENVAPASSGTAHLLNDWSGTATAGQWANDSNYFIDGPFLENQGLENITNASDGSYFSFLSASNASTATSITTFQNVATSVNQYYNLSGLFGNLETTSRANSTTGAIAAVYVNDVAVHTEVESEWSTFSHTFLADSTNTKISIGFIQGDGNSSSVLVADNFELVATIPEPSALVLLSSSLMLFGLRRKR